MKTTLVEVNQLLRDEEKDEDDREIELSARLESLLESVHVVKKLDDEIADLIEDDDEAEKDEKEALAYHLKISAAIKTIELSFRKKQIKKLKDEQRENL